MPTTSTTGKEMMLSEYLESSITLLSSSHFTPTVTYKGQLCTQEVALFVVVEYDRTVLNSLLRLDLFSTGHNCAMGL